MIQLRCGARGIAPVIASLIASRVCICRPLPRSTVMPLAADWNSRSRAILRIAADHAEFALPETKIGTQPGWTGSQRLPALIGVARAKQMIFTGARIIADMSRNAGAGQRSCAARSIDAARTRNRKQDRIERAARGAVCENDC